MTHWKHVSSSLPFYKLSGNESLLASQIGVQRLNGLSVLSAIRLVAPDIFVLTVTVGLLVCYSTRCRRNRQPTSSGPIDDLERSPRENPTDHENRKQTTQRSRHTSSGTKLTLCANSSFLNKLFRKHYNPFALHTFLLYFTVFMVCVVGIIAPSLLSLIYLLTFISICTYWACVIRDNSALFNAVRIFLILYSGMHVCVYYLYQFPFFHTLVKDGSILARWDRVYVLSHNYAIFLFITLTDV